jgi:hypothetical protein
MEILMPAVSSFAKGSHRRPPLYRAKPPTKLHLSSASAPAREPDTPTRAHGSDPPPPATEAHDVGDACVAEGESLAPTAMPVSRPAEPLERDGALVAAISLRGGSPARRGTLAAGGACLLAALSLGGAWLVYHGSAGADAAAPDPAGASAHSDLAAQAPPTGEAPAPSEATQPSWSEEAEFSWDPQPGAFDRAAASSALDRAVATTHRCPPLGGAATIEARVTFSPAGKVSAIAFTPSWVETLPAGRCVAGRLKRVTVPPFGGEPVSTYVRLSQRSPSVAESTAAKPSARASQGGSAVAEVHGAASDGAPPGDATRAAAPQDDASNGVAAAGLPKRPKGYMPEGI